MSSYLGDFPAGATVRRKFNTAQFSDGAPITLAGTPAVKVYRDGSTTTEVTTGATLAVDFDALTGLHEVAVDLSSDATFYAAGHDYSVVLTAGTVGGTSVVGTVLAHFSIMNRYFGVDADGVPMESQLLTPTIDRTGAVAASPAPTATGFTVTLDAAADASTVAADFVGLYLTFTSGARLPVPGRITAATKNSTTSWALTFASGTFAAAPAAADTVMISG